MLDFGLFHFEQELIMIMILQIFEEEPSSLGSDFHGGPLTVLFCEEL